MYLCRAFERPSKPLKGSKLRRTSNLTFLKTGLKLLTEKQWLRLSLATIEYATNTYEKYFYTFRINQLNLPMVKEKRNGLTFTECSVKIFRFLLLTPPYWKWSYHNATQSECAHCDTGWRTPKSVKRRSSQVDFRLRNPNSPDVVLVIKPYLAFLTRTIV